MFDYTHIVKSSDGAEWGLFKAKGVATILANALDAKFGGTLEFWVEEIK